MEVYSFMRSHILKRWVSIAAAVVLLFSQLIAVEGNSTGVRFDGAAQYATSGKVNCFPDKGEWGKNDDKFYIKYDQDSGDEYKPVNGDADFTYCWYMPLDGVKAQIDNGLQYKIDFDVLGHILDFDYACVYVDFWVPVGEGVTGFVTDQTLFEDVDQWKHRSFSGYIPEGATYLRLRLASRKATGMLTDSDAAIFYRNIEVYIIDETAPAPSGIEYGSRYELGTPEMRKFKDYYGVGSDVYWDVEFSEPVFVDDPGYLAYARGLNSGERATLANSYLSKDYPKAAAVISHVLNNNGASVGQQFGELTMKFRYRNSDGSEHTGYAAVVDKSLYNTETYGNDYSKQIKFKYTVRPGDDFTAEDIYEMELVGGIITDNAYNMMPEEYRKISFDSKTGSSLNTIYRKYFQNFKAETTAPVLLEVNGRTPDGLISQSTDLGLYLKFSEPVYMTMSDEAFEKNGIDKFEFNDLSFKGLLHAGEYSLNMNSKYVDSSGKESPVYGIPKAYYESGNGTTMLKFNYRVHENKFDPLEVTGSEITRSGASCGEIYIMDTAGNTAPLVQKNNVELSGSKHYVADVESPEIAVQVVMAESAKGGFYIRIDVTDKGEGVDYDRLRFGFGYADLTASSLWNNTKPLIPGKLYHSEELKQLFGIDTAKSDKFRILVDARDKKGNDHFSPKYGAGWYAEINADTAGPVLDRCYVDTEKYSSLAGSFTAVFKDGTSGAANQGMGAAPNIRYRWVSSGFNPDTEEWQTPTRAYSAGAGYYYAEGPKPSGYIYGAADLYLKAVDLAGNETVHYVPKALSSSFLGNMEDRLTFDFQTWGKGRIYACVAKRFYGNTGVSKPFKGLWYCLTESGDMPVFSETSGLWKYKDGKTVQSNDYDSSPRDRNGYYFMHVIAVDNDGKAIGAATSPEMLYFNFVEPKITVSTEKRADGSLTAIPFVSDKDLRKEELKAEYCLNYSYDWKPLPENGEIIIGKELLDDYAMLLIRTTKPGYTINPQIFGPYTNRRNQLSAPYINYYGGTRHTNQDFKQLLISTAADEFAYSLDGTSWSSWLTLDKESDASGYGLCYPAVPLPNKEGEITFYTKYRKLTGEETAAVQAYAVRDITPPTGEISYTSYNGSSYWYTAKPVNLKDNLCSSDKVEVVGAKSEIIPRGEPYYLVIRDEAGNKAELKAYLEPEPVVITVPDGGGHNDKDNDNPESSDDEAPAISVSPNGNIDDVKSITASITVTDENSISNIAYAFSTEYNSGAVSGWTETANNSTVSLSSVSGTYYLYVRATDSEGNTRTFRSEPYFLDNEAPEIEISPDGNTNNAQSVSVDIDSRDNRSVEKVEYAFSTDDDPAAAESWMETGYESTVSLSGVEGVYYLHVRAEDEAGNTAVITSAPYNMVMEYTEPYLVYSGEAEGSIRAFIVSEEPIGVTEAVYDLNRGDPQHTFNYIFAGDGSEGSITTDWKFDSLEDWELGMIDEYKGDVEFKPYNGVTSGPVEVIIESKKYETGDEYLCYSDEIDFDASKLAELIKAGKLRILVGCTRKGYWGDAEIVREITEDAPVTYDEEFIQALEEAEEAVYIYKLEITVEENCTLEYGINDGGFSIYVGHIVEDETLEDNVLMLTLSNGKLWTYAPWYLLASADRYAAYAGMLRLYESLSGADLTPPEGKVDYTQADGNQGPVTAKLTVSDDSSGDIAITSQGGSSHIFDKNGQFIFEFADKSGNKGRTLAEVGSMNRTASGVDISYSTRYPTKGNVKVTMLPEAGTTLKSGDAATIFEDGAYSFVAADNGQWKFTFVNQAGVETEAAVAVANIDRTPPQLNVEYYKNTYNNSVIALVSSGEQIWASAGGSLTHVFSTNGQYTMKAVDEAGNEASIAASVSSIDAAGPYRSSIDVKVGYSTQAPTNKPVKLTLTSDRAFTVLNNGGKMEKEVARSGKYQFIVKDSLGLIKIVEANVLNIDTEAPVITLGYPENTSAIAGDLIDPMNFTAVDNFDGDVKAKVKVEGNINTQQPGTYRMIYTVADSCGNTAAKTFSIKVLGSGEQIVTVNGFKYESEPLMLGTSRLQVAARGFAGQYGIKWTKGYETEAFFKDHGNEADSGTIPISATGWYTLYISDAERNSRLVHVYISDLGGEQ